MGKNLVGMMLEGAGFKVKDLGVDVAPETFVSAADEVDVIGLSALLTTTMGSMKTTLDALDAAGKRPKVKVIVGGAPVTEDFARQIGAPMAMQPMRARQSLSQSPWFLPRTDRDTDPFLISQIHYGFNFQWMCSWKPHQKPEPADEKALDFLAEFGVNFVRIPLDYRFWTRDLDYFHPDVWRATSAGGGYSTVGDILGYAQALASHRILSAQWIEEATQEKVKSGKGYGYGYGFVTVRKGGVQFFGHGGGAPGMNGELRIYPESGTVIAVLSNLDPPAATRVADWLEQRCRAG